MFDFSTLNTMLNNRWIKHYFQYENTIWYFIPNLIFVKMGVLAFLLQCNFELRKIPVRFSHFHRQVLLSWLLIYKHIFFSKTNV